MSYSNLKQRFKSMTFGLRTKQLIAFEFNDSMYNGFCATYFLSFLPEIICWSCSANRMWWSVVSKQSMTRPKHGFHYNGRRTWFYCLAAIETVFDGWFIQSFAIWCKLCCCRCVQVEIYHVCSVQPGLDVKSKEYSSKLENGTYSFFYNVKIFSY